MPFTTGVRIASWAGTLLNIEAFHCRTGILLEFPFDYTNGVTLYDCTIIGPEDNDSIGVKIKGGNNRIIGGNLQTGLEAGDTTHSTICIQVGEPGFPGVWENVITGPYLEGGGDIAKGINLDDDSISTQMMGCYFDLTNAISFNNSKMNNSFGNYEGRTKNGNWILGYNGDPVSESPFKVGIGTGLPTQMLEVGSHDYGGNYQQNAAIGWRDGFRMSRGGAGVAGMGVDSSGSALQLYTGETLGDDTARLTILSGGNVGIGTASPQRKLHVVGDAVQFDRDNNDAGILINNTKDGVVSTNLLVENTAPGTGIFKIKHQGYTRIAVKNDGNVGIGTTSPAEKLHVYDGNVDVEKNYDGDTRLKIRNTNASGTGGSAALEFSFGDDYTTRLRQSNYLFEIGFNNKFQLRLRGSANPVFYTDGGNVGIGTTSPNEKFEVNGAITVGNTSHSTPTNGTIKFDGTNLKVYINGWHTIV